MASEVPSSPLTAAGGSATVELAFSPLPAHVRTARLIVTAVARRSGVEETLLDEVRLAVGEACSRAVEAHRLHCPAEPVRVALTDGSERFHVVVADQVPDDDPVGADLPPDDMADLGDDIDLGFAVISGLADDVDIASTAAGVEIRMSWPAKKE